MAQEIVFEVGKKYRDKYGFVHDCVYVGHYGARSENYKFVILLEEGSREAGTYYQDRWKEFEAVEAEDVLIKIRELIEINERIYGEIKQLGKLIK